MKKELFLYAFMLISPFVLSAQDWLDVTNIYVENPHFDNGSTTGWQWNSNAGSQRQDTEEWNSGMVGSTSTRPYKYPMENIVFQCKVSIACRNIIRHTAIIGTEKKL